MRFGNYCKLVNQKGCENKLYIGRPHVMLRLCPPKLQDRVKQSGMEQYQTIMSH
jgi:hypothetical protein